MTAIQKFVNRYGARIAANPQKALAAVTSAVPVVTEIAAVVVPVAIVGAAGYGTYRLVKWIFD